MRRLGRLRWVLPLALGSLLLGFGAAQEAAGPKKVALVVGINHYQRRGFPDLQFAERDAADLAAALKGLGFEVVTLTGNSSGPRKATRHNIETALRSLLADVGKEDLVLVALSGHGQQLKVKGDDGREKEDGFFCPVDAIKDDPESELSLSFVLDDVLAKQGGRNLLLVDACRDVPQDPGRG